MNDDVLEILRCYPQVYLACHVDHVRKRSSEQTLSSNASSILAQYAAPSCSILLHPSRGAK